MCTSTIDNHSNGANRLQLSNCIAKSISTQPNRTQLDWERDWHRQSHPELIVRICISRSRLYQAVCPFCVSLAFAAIYFLHNLCTHSDNTPDKQWKPWWVWATTDNDRTMLTCVDGHRYYKKLHSNQLLIRKGYSRSVRAGSKKLALQFTTHFSATTLFTTLVVIVPNKDRNLPTPAIVWQKHLHNILILYPFPLRRVVDFVWCEFVAPSPQAPPTVLRYRQEDAKWRPLLQPLTRESRGASAGCKEIVQTYPRTRRHGTLDVFPGIGVQYLKR